MDIQYIIKDFFKCKGDINKFLINRVSNLHYGGYRSISEKNLNLIHAIITEENTIYKTPVPFAVLNEVNTEYCYTDLRPTDKVLDIGANIGAFSLKVRDKCSHVYAVEPYFHNELYKNVELNNALDKISILPYALGNNKNEKNLSEIIQLCGGKIDFLKCDCEGGEWVINANDLEGIRRIEIEIHSFNGENLLEWLKLLTNYSFKVQYRDDGITVTLLVHAFKNNV